MQLANLSIAVSTSTDVVKNVASVILTHPGLRGIEQLVVISRQIHQRIATWILNKIVKTIQATVFICMGYIFYGILPITERHMIYLLFCLDFVTLALATDRVDSRLFAAKRWELVKLMTISTIIGLVSIMEFCLYYQNVRPLLKNTGELQTVVFQMLFFYGIFNVVILREYRFWWRSTPGTQVCWAFLLDIMLVSVATTFGILGLTPVNLSWTFLTFAYIPFIILQTLSYSFFCSLCVNDIFKVTLVVALDLH